MEIPQSVLQTGSLAGLAAFLWRLYETFSGYLDVSLSLTNDGHFVKAVAGIKNRGVVRQQLDYALLLVGPHDEYPAETARRLSFCKEHPTGIAIDETDAIVHLKQTFPDPLTDRAGKSALARYEDSCRAVISLPFFHWEQDDIADEEVKYCYPIDSARLRPGAYSVRFFVFPNPDWWRRIRKRPALLRCTQDLFVIDKTKPSAAPDASDAEIL